MSIALLKRLVPNLGPVSGGERLRACAGALLSILITGFLTRLALGPEASVPLLIAPMGASAVLLFAVPSSPLAQPWSIVGGNTIAALVGVTSAKLIADPFVASSVAISVAIGAMFALRCLHPPSGAVALTAVLGGPAVQAADYGFALWPVGINSLLMLAAALVFNNLTGRRYPHLSPATAANPRGTADPPPTARIGFTSADLDAVLARYDQVLDVSRDDLDALLHQAEIQAYHRRSGEITCADIMSRDVVGVSPDTPLREAWSLMRSRRLKALPVTSENARVVGIVTHSDFMENAEWAPAGPHIGLGRRLRRAVRLESAPRATVAEIMTAPVRSAAARTRIAELVPMMADAGLHHLPVTDGDGRLVGIVTQSDLIAALFRGRITEQDESPPRFAAE